MNRVLHPGMTLGLTMYPMRASGPAMECMSVDRSQGNPRVDGLTAEERVQQQDDSTTGLDH